VGGADTPIGRLLAWLVGFPQAAADVPVTVEMRLDAQGEVWTRNFAGRTFRSRLATIPGRGTRVSERFGWLTFDLALTASPVGLDLAIATGRLGPVPLPFVPHSCATERVDAAGRFCFDVPVVAPGLGLLVHYRGWLIPVAAASGDAKCRGAVAAR